MKGVIIMPLRILKIAVTAEVSTDVNPEVTRFFHVLSTEATEGTLTLEVDDFETDDGTTATSLPDLETDNSYYNVYINGVLQMEGITSYVPGGVGTGQLQITVGAGETIEANTPIVLEVVNYSPASTVDVNT